MKIIGRRGFLKFGREGLILSEKYKDWLNQDCHLFSAALERSKKRSVNEKEDIEDETNESMKLIRERSGGRNIFDAEKTVFTKCPDGTLKK